jgi:hypothetical protein
MKTCEGVGAELHKFLNSALDGGEWSASRPGRFIHGGRAPDIYRIGGSVDTRAGLDLVAKRQKYLPLPKIELRSSIPEIIHYTSRASLAN